MDWQILPTRSGLRAVAENVVERRYGTEAMMPIGPGGIDLSFFRASAGEFDPANTFEPKNTGQTLEIEPTLSWDGEVADLASDLRVCELTEFRRWASGKNEAGSQSFSFQPTFNARTTQASFSATLNRRRLLSFSHLPKSLLGDGGDYEIILLRAFLPK